MDLTDRLAEKIYNIRPRPTRWTELSAELRQPYIDRARTALADIDATSLETHDCRGEYECTGHPECGYAKCPNCNAPNLRCVCDLLYMRAHDK